MNFLESLKNNETVEIKLNMLSQRCQTLEKLKTKSPQDGAQYLIYRLTAQRTEEMLPVN